MSDTDVSQIQGSQGPKGALSDKPLIVLIAGPYMSGTGGDPDKIAANRARLESFALPIYQRGNLALVGEWLALPIIHAAGGKAHGDAVFESFQYRWPRGSSNAAMRFCASPVIRAGPIWMSLAHVRSACRCTRASTSCRCARRLPLRLQHELARGGPPASQVAPQAPDGCSASNTV